MQGIKGYVQNRYAAQETKCRMRNKLLVQSSDVCTELGDAMGEIGKEE